MFHGELFFAAFLALPAVVALILRALTHTSTSYKGSHVPSHYWGAYSGQSDKPKKNLAKSIKLYVPRIDDNAPSVIPQHAVHWHP